jgi:hypothetical protein
MPLVFLQELMKKVAPELKDISKIDAVTASNIVNILHKIVQCNHPQRTSTPALAMHRSSSTCALMEAQSSRTRAPSRQGSNTDAPNQQGDTSTRALMLQLTRVAAPENMAVGFIKYLENKVSIPF